ncbi:GntR family transcriptional regulator [Pusillimonas sp.]|uniref:GntR family transcriptional regulator n=1 Tax=Pusillimonas sp. TaxID=3040095 RepID=UPI0037CC2E91
MSLENTTNFPVSEQAYRALRRAIVRCEFVPDERLRVDDISTRYGFSSSPVREALARLAEQGFVRSIENRGFRVAPITSEGIVDLTRVRLLIETDALRAAIDNGDDQWEEGIVAAAHSLRLAEQRLAEGPIALDEAWSERHRAFHMALYAACQSPLMLNLIEQLSDNAERYRRYSARFRTVSRKKNQEHQQLMKAVLERDKRTAVTLLRKHIVGTERGVLESAQFMNASNQKKTA